MVRMTRRAAETSDTESFWLRKAKLDLLQRDPVDAVNDAEALVRFAQARLDALSKRDAGAHRS
jgi:hypothetical protein